MRKGMFMSGHHRCDALRRSPPSRFGAALDGGSARAWKTALLLVAASVLSCGDGGTSGSGGSATTGTTGGQAGSTATGGGTTGGTAGSGGNTTGGSTTGGGTTGGSTAGGSTTGGTAGSTGGSTGGMSGGTGGTTGSGGMSGGTGGMVGGAGGSGTGGAVGQGGTWMSPPLVMMPDLPAPKDYSDYPVDNQGRTIVMQGPGVNWVLNDVPDALTARDLCAQLVSNCFEPGVRSLDACFMSAPHCTTATPWNEPAPCCADACFTAYATERTNKVDPLTAYLRVLYDTPICMPGVDDKLGGAP